MTPGLFAFIHDDEDAIISMSIAFVGIYMYTFIYFGVHIFDLVPVFPTLPQAIHDDKRT